jgi:hypothetical protein
VFFIVTGCSIVEQLLLLMYGNLASIYTTAFFVLFLVPLYSYTVITPLFCEYAVPSSLMHTRNKISIKLNGAGSIGLCLSSSSNIHSSVLRYTCDFCMVLSYMLPNEAMLKLMSRMLTKKVKK